MIRCISFALREELINFPALSVLIECGLALGMENKRILDRNIKASTKKDWTHQAKEGRLNGQRAWCSADDRRPYIEIDLGKPYRITAIATQGSSIDNKWVRLYALASNLAGSSITTYIENNREKVHTTIHINYSPSISSIL